MDNDSAQTFHNVKEALTLAGMDHMIDLDNTPRGYLLRFWIQLKHIIHHTLDVRKAVMYLVAPFGSTHRDLSLPDCCKATLSEYRHHIAGNIVIIWVEPDPEAA